MAASVASGISAAQRPKNSVMSSSVIAWMMPATGVRPPFLTFVAVRAMAPVAGMPPNSGDDDVGDALRDQLHVRAVAPADHAVGHDRREQRLDRAEGGDGEARARPAHGRFGQRDRGQRRAGKPGVNPAEAAADRLDRQVKSWPATVVDDQRHERAGHGGSPGARDR